MRLAPTSAALLLTVSAAGGGVAIAATAGTRATDAARSAASPPRTIAENEAAAHAEAEALLAQVPLPPGATPSATEPAGDDSLLARPAEGPPDTPNVVDDHDWWVLPGTPREALAYIKAREPAEARYNFTHGSGGGPGEPQNEFMVFTWPPVAGVLDTRQLALEAVQLPGHSTGLRADAEVVWLTPRPASEVIPAGARVMRISVLDVIALKIKQRPLVVTNPRRIARVVALLNALPAWQPGVSGCPNDSGVRVRLVLRLRRHLTPQAVADINPEGCGGVALTIAGKRQPALEGGFALMAKIERVLGIRLDLRPGQRRQAAGGAR